MQQSKINNLAIILCTLEGDTSGDWAVLVLINWTEWMSGWQSTWFGGDPLVFCSLNPLPIWEGNSETYHLQHTQQLLEATTDSLHYSFLVSKKPGILYSRIFLCSSYRISQSGPSAAPYAPFPIAFEFWAYFWHRLLDAFCWGWKSSKWNLWKLIVLLLCDSRKKKAKRIKSTWRNLNFFVRSL